MSNLRKKLEIDEYLDLVKEDRNCNVAYISFAQYIYFLEKTLNEIRKDVEVINYDTEELMVIQLKEDILQKIDEVLGDEK